MESGSKALCAARIFFVKTMRVQRVRCVSGFSPVISSFYVSKYLVYPRTSRLDDLDYNRTFRGGDFKLQASSLAWRRWQSLSRGTSRPGLWSPIIQTGMPPRKRRMYYCYSSSIIAWSFPL